MVRVYQYLRQFPEAIDFACATPIQNQWPQEIGENVVGGWVEKSRERNDESCAAVHSMIFWNVRFDSQDI